MVEITNHTDTNLKETKRMPSTEINLDELEASIANLTEEDIRKQLLEIRTRQKVMQKKYHDPVKAKEYRAKKSAFQALLAKKAKQMGIYDSILDAANEAADAKLAAEEAEKGEPVEA